MNKASFFVVFGLLLSNACVWSMRRMGRLWRPLFVMSRGYKTWRHAAGNSIFYVTTEEQKPCPKAQEVALDAQVLSGSSFETLDPYDRHQIFLKLCSSLSEIDQEKAGDLFKRKFEQLDDVSQNNLHAFVSDIGKQRQKATGSIVIFKVLDPSSKPGILCKTQLVVLQPPKIADSIDH